MADKKDTEPTVSKEEIARIYWFPQYDEEYLRCTECGWRHPAAAMKPFCPDCGERLMISRRVKDEDSN